MLAELKAPFLQLCHHIGKKTPYWIQATGGNVSVKSGDHPSHQPQRLWIKASGVRLKDVSETNGIAEVNLGQFQKNFHDLDENSADGELRYSNCIQEAANSANSNGGRPSMETGMHAVLKRRWVSHFHSVTAVLMADEYFSDSRAQLMEWLKSEWSDSLVFVDWVMPGLFLSKKCAMHANISALVLRNHGVILQSDDSLDLINAWERLERRYQERGPIDTAGPSGRGETPLKIYFPDTAVFLSRMRQSPLSEDMTELWDATTYLYQAKSSLKEFPKELSEKISGLPTEVFRQSVMEGRRE